MKASVTKDKVSIIEKDIVHAGEYNINHIEFEFSAEYTADLVKNAVFSIKDNVYQTSIINDQCDIPAEILSDFGEVVFGVYAYKVNDDQLELRYSPFPARFTIISGSYDPTAEESEEITPSQFEQYMQALNDGLNKVEESIKKMDEATSSATQLVDKIEQKLENGDFIGPEGPQGPQGGPGKDGVNGQDGIGITTITSGQSTIEEDKTITPVTVQKTDGSSQSFKVEAKNGLDGQNGKDGKDGVNGQDGLTPTIGENGNWFLGDTDTGKPSRGEVGPSPDLSNYVKNTDYATNNKTGVINGNINGFQVSSSGNPYAKEYTAEEYDNVGNKDFIGKGTLENAKDKIVGSSTPVQDLTSTVTNIQEEQDESKPKNTASGEMITVDDALAYKTFNVTVDGASEQVVTTGKNKLQITTFNDGTKSKTLNGVTANINENGTISLSGTTSAETQFYLTKNDFSLESGNGYFWCNSPSVNCRFEFVASIDGEEKYLNSYSTTPNTFNITSSFVYSGSTIIVASGTSTNVTLTPMVSNGTFTEYEPYTGGQPSPSPDYPQEITTLTFDKITRCGKNLLDNIAISRTVNGVTFTVNEDKTITVNGTATKYTNVNLSGPNNKLIPITGNYISGGTNNVRFQIMNAETGSYISLASSNSYGSTSINKSRFNRGYFEIIVTEGTTVNNEVVKPMMTIDSITSEEYEPYQGQTYDIDLQGNEMVEIPNGVKDELVIDKQGNVSLIKNVGKIILDGSENWVSLPATDTYWEFSIIYETGQQANYSYSLSNYFSDKDYNRLICTKLEVYIRFPKNIGIDVSDAEKFKSWLQSHNTIAYYELTEHKQYH